MIDVSKIEQIFLGAVSLDQAERSEYLDSHCGSDGELRQRVEALLAAQPDVGDFLEPPITGNTQDFGQTKDHPIGMVVAIRFEYYERQMP
ncbi:MAG: hypothetical protein NTY15_11185 [Planctomycetota bacterium]|nr:hypothetical protein [Planctomycetota bacterium]